MGEIGFLLQAEAGKWAGTAEQQLSPEWRAALKTAAGELGKVASYALGSYELHIENRGLARDAEHRDWLEGQGYVAAGPRELP